MTTQMDVSGPVSCRVTVEFARAASGEVAVMGQVLDEHGQGVPFSGWIGLLEVLEGFATPTGAPAPGPQEVTP